MSNGFKEIIFLQGKHNSQLEQEKMLDLTSQRKYK